MTYSRALILLLLVTLGAFAAGTLIAPSNKEVALMHLRDSDYDEALKLYDHLESKGDDSISVVVPLVNLHVHYGDSDKAVAILETYTSKHKRSIDARRRLADLYRESQRLNDYCRTLEDIQEMAPNTDDLRKLADTYDLMGLYPQEAHALERLIDMKGYVPHEEDYSKLAVFDRTAGKPDEAIRVITQGIDAKKYDVNIDTVHVAVQLLLEQRREGQAESTANKYMEKSAKESDAVTLSSLFQSYNDLEAAYNIITPYLSDIDKSISLEQQVVSVLMAQKRENEVFTLLDRQFNQKILPIPLTDTLLDLSVKHKNLDLVEAITKQIDLERIPEDALLRYADFSFRTKMPAIAQIMQQRLSKSFQQQNTLLAAVIEVAANNSQKGVEILLSLPESAIPLPEEKLIVSGIFVQYGHLNQARTLFEHVPVSGIFEILDPAQLAVLYLDAGDPQQGERKLKEEQQGTGPIGELISRSLFFLAVGEGKTEEAQAWLKDHGADQPLLSDAYYVASRYHRDVLALDIARELYRSSQSPENTTQLTDALLSNHRYAEAVKFLHKSGARTGQPRQAYLDAVAGWIDYEGKTHSGQDLDYLSSTVSDLNKYNLSPEEKRNFAYLLEQSGFHDLAEGWFVDLASNQPFNGPDVQELLGFWGDNLSQQAIDWISNRARNADPAEKMLWLGYLNDANHPDIVVSMLKDQTDLSIPLSDLYLSALIAIHNKEDLHRVLAKNIEDEEGEDRLKHLAQLAEGENMPDLAAQAWQDIYDVDPGNSEAAKWLGLRAFDKHQYAEAGKLLQQYIHDENNDYRASFAYAEILATSPDKKAQAAPYYKTALSQVSQLNDQSVGTLEDKARLLSVNHQQQQALELLRKLFAENPENKSVRADLAETLIQMGQFKDAAMLLPQ